MKDLVKRLGAAPALTRLGAARARGGILILNYHDVAADGQPSSWLRVPQGEFDRQLARLGRLGEFVGPEALAGAGGGDGRLRLLLTFDDGYVNNYRLALPVLRRHGAPALFFVSTWHTQTQEPFWFDRVVSPIQAEGLAALDLSEVGLRHYRFRAPDGPGRWDDIQRLLVDITALGNPGEAAVDRVLARCAAAGGAAAARALADCRPLAPDELRAMRDSGLCRFGSHAHRHEILTLLDDAALADGLTASRAFLERTLDLPVGDIAYPNGDVDGRVVAAARAAGYRRGYTVREAPRLPGDDPLRMPRVLVGGYDTPALLSWRLNRALLFGPRKD
ncbi:MAG: polysaccharide deacetylase family protein [Candidatus Krumholzibacteriia bacterium]